MRDAMTAIDCLMSVFFGVCLGCAGLAYELFNGWW